MLTLTVCAALSAAGLAVALLTAYRRRFVAATRIAAFALLPVGLALAGLVGLAARIGRAIGHWGADLVLRPSVWAGLAVLALAVVLFFAARAAGRRSARRATAGAGGAQAPAAASPALGSTPADRAGAAGARAREAGDRRRGDGGGDDYAEIEEILKKHGI